MDFSKVGWVFDKDMQDRLLPTGQPTLLEAVQELGCPAQTTAWDRASAEISPPVTIPPGCMVTHGSIRFVRQVEASCRLWHSPIAFARFKNMAYSAFSYYLSDYMLNDSYVLLPLGEIMHREMSVGGYCNFFVKPDSSHKTFTGTVVSYDNYQTQLATLWKLSGEDPTLLCVVSPAVTIDSEYRFVIADRQVVAGSQYTWDDRLDVRSDVLPAARLLAEKIAALDWQPDRVYTCDIAMTPFAGARLVELNAFSTSGLYACDTRAVARAVSEVAWREFVGED